MALIGGYASTHVQSQHSGGRRTKISTSVTIINIISITTIGTIITIITISTINTISITSINTSSSTIAITWGSGGIGISAD